MRDSDASNSAVNLAGRVSSRRSKKYLPEKDLVSAEERRIHLPREGALEQLAKCTEVVSIAMFDSRQQLEQGYCGACQRDLVNREVLASVEWDQNVSLGDGL